MATPEEDAMNKINARLDSLITSIEDEIETMKNKLDGEVNNQLKTNIENDIRSLTGMLEKITVIKNDLISGEIKSHSQVLGNPNYEKIDQIFSGGRRRTNRKRRTKRRKTNKRRKTKRRRARK